MAEMTELRTWAKVFISEQELRSIRIRAEVLARIETIASVRDAYKLLAKAAGAVDVELELKRIFREENGETAITEE